MAQKNKLIIAVCALCLVATIGFAFACTVAPGGFRFLVYQSGTGSWNINLGVTHFEEPKSFDITVESKDTAGTFGAVYFLTVKGPTGLRNDDLTLHWLDTDGADFVIGNGGSQAFLGVGILNWNSAPVEFPGIHKNKMTLTLTFKPTAPRGTYNGNMWVAFTEKVEAHVEIMPKVLNLKSKGEPVLAIIRLPETCDAGKVDVKSVRLWFMSGYVQAQSGVATKHYLLVMFPREEVRQMLSSQRGCVKLGVTGLVNNVEFYGTDTIIVIKGQCIFK